MKPFALIVAALIVLNACTEPAAKTEAVELKKVSTPSIPGDETPTKDMTLEQLMELPVSEEPELVTPK